MQTEIIAWAGVVIGIVSLGWHVYVHTTNRGKLKVDAFLLTVNNLDTETVKVEIRCTVTNWGRQPVFVVKTGVDYQGMTWSWGGGDSGLPKRLAPGEWHTVAFDYLGKSHGLAKDVWAYDSLGRKYRIGRKERRTIVAQAKEIEQERPRVKQSAE